MKWNRQLKFRAHNLLLSFVTSLWPILGRLGSNSRQCGLVVRLEEFLRGCRCSLKWELGVHMPAVSPGRHGAFRSSVFRNIYKRLGSVELASPRHNLEPTIPKSTAEMPCSIRLSPGLFHQRAVWQTDRPEDKERRPANGCVMSAKSLERCGRASH